MTSASQLCNGITTLLAVTYQRHLSTARIRGVIHFLEAVRKLEFIHESHEAKRTFSNQTLNPYNRYSDNRNKYVKISAVKVEYKEMQEVVINVDRDARSTRFQQSIPDKRREDDKNYRDDKN